MGNTKKKQIIKEDVVEDDFEDVAATAQMAHYGQKRRTGEDYITHPAEVSQIVKQFYPTDKVSRLVALLHDTMEDAPSQGTVKDIDEMKSFIRGSIGDEEIAENVIDAVESLTHDKESQPDYGAYVKTILGNKIALRVKLADMLHNLTNNASPKQITKYGTALKDISTMVGGIPKSISPHHWRALAQASGQDLTSAKRAVSESKKVRIMTKSQVREIIQKLVKEQVESGNKKQQDIKSRFEDYLYQWSKDNEDDLVRALEEAAYDSLKPTPSDLREIFLEDIKENSTDPQISRALAQNQQGFIDIIERMFNKFIVKHWEDAKAYAMSMDGDPDGSWTDSFQRDEPYGRLTGPESDMW